jgi:hypothetical protein
VKSGTGFGAAVAECVRTAARMKVLIRNAGVLIVIE